MPLKHGECNRYYSVDCVELEGPCLFSVQARRSHQDLLDIQTIRKIGNETDRSSTEHAADSTRSKISPPHKRMTILAVHRNITQSCASLVLLAEDQLDNSTSFTTAVRCCIDLCKKKLWHTRPCCCVEELRHGCTGRDSSDHGLKHTIRQDRQEI